jgi:Zn-dependent peptidase ImmA (M78 family)/DNA-binding XRE family transcriptional regulator
MVGQRLQQLRLARGLSLEVLAAKMGGIVTKQSLSKYENDKANPSPYVLSKIAEALNINASHFFSEPTIRIEYVAYRKSASLLEKDRKTLKSRINQALEDRVRILDLMEQSKDTPIPIKEFTVVKIEDAEKAAEMMREKWQLGSAPILNATATIEDNSICVMNIRANDDFDGICAIVYDNEDRVKTAALVTRNEIAGERQRLNLTHELGHLVLNVKNGVDEEKAAFRFGAAFLAPAHKIFQEVGRKRSLIQLQELLFLKKQFGLSMQALLYRMHDLKIINDSYYRQWFARVNQCGWKKQEPEEWAFETSNWLQRNVLRLIAEGILSQIEAERIIGEKLELDIPASVIERRAFLKLPLDTRRRIMAGQASSIVQYYKQNNEWKGVEGGDAIEY